MTRHLLGFPPETFASRRDRVCKALRGGVLVLPAAPVFRRSRDTEHRYRPDSELAYVTGCVDPSVVAILRGSGEEGFILFVPKRDPKGEVWMGPRLGPEEAQELLGADKVFPLDELDERLPDLLRSAERVFFRLGVHDQLESMVVAALRWSRGPGSRTGAGPRVVEDPGVILDDLRLVKEPEEIARIRRATQLTVEAFGETMKKTRPGMGEWEVEACLEGAFRRVGGALPAFSTIVGSGRNGCTLHYVENRDRIEEGSLVLLDGGAELDLYAGDVTRTFPVEGRFSPRQLAVYEIVLGAQEAAIATIRPGSTVGQLHEAAVEELTRGLVRVGALGGDLADLIEEQAYKDFFPHQTSHWLGLDVHDVGDYASGAGSRVLEPGMVLTVEPGLYFSSNQEDPDFPYRGIGIRIEDDILVTEGGMENLTGSLPVAPGEVEELLRRARG